MKQVNPISLSFYELSLCTRAVHGWNKPDVDRLHDIWLRGAPTPNSRILNPKIYDPRAVQTGNVEKRLIIPKLFADWFDDVAKRRGFSLKADTAYQALGRINRAFNLVSNER